MTFQHHERRGAKYFDREVGGNDEFLEINTLAWFGQFDILPEKLQRVKVELGS
jgi:hypothetical protein